MSVKNGAELLDRLIKDIVSESAVDYVSILNYDAIAEANQGKPAEEQTDLPLAFSLKSFIPLLEERIHVTNPFARTFLIQWITLLDNIPDLDLAHYIPSFLGGLFKFLGDNNRDVFVAAQVLLQKLLDEMVRITKVKKQLAESRRDQIGMRKTSTSQASTGSPGSSVADDDDEADDNAIADSDSEHDEGFDEDGAEYVPGQDIEIDHAAILDILLKFIDPSSQKDSDPLLRLDGLSKQKEEEIGLVALRWIATFFEIASEDILVFVPRLLSQVLPALSSQSQKFRSQAVAVNQALMDYIVAYHEQDDGDEQMASSEVKEDKIASGPHSRQQSAVPEKSTPAPPMTTPETVTDAAVEIKEPDKTVMHLPSSTKSNLDYTAAVEALTVQFADKNEETRIAALSWLIMLHKQAPRRTIDLNDGTFSALLKTLSDPSEHVVTRDLQLMSQIAKISEDDYFSSFMVALLGLFSSDRRLLEIRGNLIIRQLCINLNPERIFRIMAECIERDEDVEFASIMVQNLNNNLITAPELAELRKRLRNLDSRDGQAFFVTLFKAWCHNAVASIALCLLAQAYEQAYSLIQMFGDLETTVNMLIQIDKLVQLLESPVFTYLRIQLLEPEKYPYLYRCMYGLLMLLPQSAAFAALKNRLNSVSSIALLHTPNTTATATRSSIAAGLTPSTMPGPTSSAVSRLNARRDATTAGEFKWSELVDRFRITQEKARKRNERLLRGEENEAEVGSKSSGGIPITLEKNPAISGRLSQVGTRGSIDHSFSTSQGAGGSTGLGIRNGKAQSSTLATGTSKPIADRSTALGHQKRHSMLGKFASGIARSTGHASKEKEKERDKGGGGSSSNVATQGSAVTSAGSVGVKK